MTLLKSAIALAAVPPAKAATDELAGVLEKHSYADARKDAAVALGKIGVRTPPVVAALEKATKDKSDKVAARAKEALETLSEADE
jgi:HEAT repeat protein